MLEKDKVLKTLVAIATFLVLFSLAVLAILNFAGGENQASKTTTSTQKEARNTTTKTQTTQTTKESETSQEDNNQTTRQEVVVNTTKANVVGNANPQQTRQVVTQSVTQAQQVTNPAPAPQAAGQKYVSKVFSTQEQAHKFGNDESVRISYQGKYRTRYEIETVRENGRVVGFETNIYVTPRN